MFNFILGSVIIFTALFSKIFVHREVSIRHWLGIFTIIVGLATVGTSDFLSSESKDKSTNQIILGNNNLVFMLM